MKVPKAMARKNVLVLVVLSLLAAGCGKEATGQVAAVVNGEEITLQEINAELGSSAVPDDANREAIQRAALERIIDRKLMAGQAIEDGLDKTPDYLLRQRQLTDALLVQLMRQASERSLSVPDQREIDKFITDNPTLFSNRKIFNMDRIRFPAPADVTRLTPLEDDQSMAEVAATLDSLGIDYERDETTLDSALMGVERLNRIQALPAGEPFLLTENGVVVVGVLTGSSDAPMSTEQARPFAVQAMRNQQLMTSFTERLQRARSAAEIEYQESFRPVENGATPNPR